METGQMNLRLHSSSLRQAQELFLWAASLFPKSSPPQGQEDKTERQDFIGLNFWFLEKHLSKDKSYSLLSL